MTRQEEQERAVRDYRIAIEKSVENDEQMGRYGYNSSWNETEAARLRERGRELDASESAAKEQYDELRCEESTGLSSDGYRHKIIEEVSQRKMEELREQKRAEIAAQMQNSNDNTNQL